MKYDYENDFDEIKIFPFGLVNLSRYQKIKNYKSYKKSEILLNHQL